MRQGLFLLILLLVVMPSLAMGGSYYVSSSSGADTANGSSSTPWEHHPRDVNATGNADSATLNAGDYIIMKKGETWYNVSIVPTESGSSGNHIITTTEDGFGTGANPVLCGSYDPSTLSFAADGGSYKATGLSTEPNIVVYNDTILTENDGATNTVGSNEWDWDADGGNNSLWVNVGEDPDSGTLLAGRQNFVIDQNGYNYLTWQNLTVQCGNTTTGAILLVRGTPTGSTVDSCTIRYYAKIGVQLNTVTAPITFTDNTITNQDMLATDGLKVISCPAGTITGNTIYAAVKAAGEAVELNGSSGIIFDSNTIRDCKPSGGNAIGLSLVGSSGNTVSNNTIYEIDEQCIQLNNSNSNDIHGNDISQCWNDAYYGGGGDGAGVYIWGSSEANLVHHNDIYECYLGVSVYETSGNGGDEIYYNFVRDTVVNAIGVNSDNSQSHIEIYNNSVIHNPSGLNNPSYGGHAVVVQVAGSKAKITGNLLIVEPNDSSANGISINDSGGQIVEVLTDNNLVYCVGAGAPFRLSGSNYLTLAAWQAAVQANAKIKDLSGVSNQAEANTQLANPNLVDRIANNVHLQIMSCAVNAGANSVWSGTASVVDFDGERITNGDGRIVAPGRIVDIGAFEYVPGRSISNISSTIHAETMARSLLGPN